MMTKQSLMSRFFAWPISGFLFFGCATTPAPKTHVLRLRPGQDVKQELELFARAQDLRAGAVVSAVGSLTQWHLRFADKPQGYKGQGHFEIVSLSGTLGVSGIHLHMSVANGKGAVIGGHLLEENVVYTTLELVIQEYTHLEFSREFDPTFGYKELVVRPRK